VAGKMQHYKRFLCLVCETVELFKGKRDGAYHCPICNTGIYYSAGYTEILDREIILTSPEPIRWGFFDKLRHTLVIILKKLKVVKDGKDDKEDKASSK